MSTPNPSTVRRRAARIGLRLHKVTLAEHRRHPLWGAWMLVRERDGRVVLGRKRQQMASLNDCQRYLDGLPYLDEWDLD